MGHDDRERKFEKALERHLRQGAPHDASAAANSQGELASPACPDAAMLAAFHETMLSNQEMDAAKVHIAACSRCQEILAHLEATDEVVFDAADVADEVEREKVLELRAPVLAGSPAQEEEFLSRDATPVFAARPSTASKAPQSISIGRRAKMWRWMAPAAAIAAGLLIWATTRDTLQHFKKPENSIQVAQEKPADRQFNDGLAPAPPASSPDQASQNDRLDEALKSLSESKRSAGALSARRAPAGTLGGVVGGLGGAPSEQRNRELRRESPIQGGNSVLNEAAPVKPAGNAAGQSEISVTAAAPLAPGDSAEMDKAKSKDSKKADSPALAGNAGGQNARDSGRKILEKQTLEPGVTAAELSASSAPSPQSAAPPAAAASTPAKQSVDAAAKKEAGANAMIATTEQAQVTANYERSSSRQNDKAGAAKPKSKLQAAKNTNTQTNDARTKDATLILTPGGTVLWRLLPGGKIERSMDRGVTWWQQDSGVNIELLAGSAPSDAACWLVGRAGTVLRTTDSGGHWSKVVSPITGDMGGIRAEDALRATIFDAANKARFATSDGGLTWTPVKE